MFFKILMRNNEGGNEKQEIYLVWPYMEICIGGWSWVCHPYIES